ncbi:MAG: hypothetical protein GX344_12425 [Intrasporangiaceae bacterium]|nr:hypothetical protein [Intrasporangiaceae bacterium]
MTYRFSLRSIRAGAVAAVAAVVLVGCNGGTEVEDPPTTASPSAPTSSPESSPSPTELESTEEPTEGPTAEPTEASALPELPEAAKENTPEGAEAFIRYYFDVANIAMMTPQVGLIPTLAHADCQSCKAMEMDAETLVRDGQRAASQVYDVQSMAVVGGTSQDVELFNMVVLLPGSDIEMEGDVVEEGAAPAEYSGTGGAKWNGEQWELLDLDLHT